MEVRKGISFTELSNIYNNNNALRPDNSVRRSFTPVVITKSKDVEHVCNLIRNHCSKYKVIGFDAEWRPSFSKGESRHPVALLQIAPPCGAFVYLFRLNLMPRMPPALRSLLEDKNIVKVGVSPEYDKQNLFEDFGVNVQSTIELRILLNTKRGLEWIAKEVLDLQLDKKTARTNWAQRVLTDRQIFYAAMDAFVGVEVFKIWAGIDFAVPDPDYIWGIVVQMLAPLYHVTFLSLQPKQEKKPKRESCKPVNALAENIAKDSFWWTYKSKVCFDDAEKLFYENLGNMMKKFVVEPVPIVEKSGESISQVDCGTVLINGQQGLDESIAEDDCCAFKCCCHNAENLYYQKLAKKTKNELQKPVTIAKKCQELQAIVKNQEDIFLKTVPMSLAEDLVRKGNAELVTYEIRLLRNTADVFEQSLSTKETSEQLLQGNSNKKGTSEQFSQEAIPGTSGQVKNSIKPSKIDDKKPSRQRKVKAKKVVAPHLVNNTGNTPVPVKAKIGIKKPSASLMTIKVEPGPSKQSKKVNKSEVLLARLSSSASNIQRLKSVALQASNVPSQAGASKSRTKSRNRRKRNVKAVASENPGVQSSEFRNSPAVSSSLRMVTTVKKVGVVSTPTLNAPYHNICVPGTSKQTDGRAFSSLLSTTEALPSTSKRLGGSVKNAIQSSVVDKRCVVCGTRGKLSKKNIVPKVYIEFLPANLRADNTLDLCASCERGCLCYSQNLMDILNYSAGLPVSHTVGDAIIALENEALAPQARFGIGDSVFHRFLRKSNSWYFPEVFKGRSSGAAVINLYKINNIPLSELRHLWRTAFLESMKPMFLPPHWSVV